MIVTEVEAKTKTCPFMSQQRLTGHHGIGGAEIHCRASGCMKWRWAPGKSPEELEDRKKWVDIPNTNPTEPTGYCG